MLRLFPILMLSLASSTIAAQDLPTALQLAVTQHPSVAGKQAELAAKGFTGEAVRAQRYPSFSAQAAIQDGAQPATLRARQPLYAFGRIDSNIAFADAEITMEQADLMRVERDLLVKTAVAYARVLGAQAKVKLADENVATLDAFYQRIQRRHAGELASQADVRLALSRLMQAQSQRERLQGDVILAETELYALTQQPIPVQQALPERLLQLPSLAEIEEFAQQNSTEVLVKQRKLLVAQADSEREQKASMPTVYLQADQLLNQSSAQKKTNVGIILEGNIDGMGLSFIGRNKAAAARIQAVQAEVNNALNEVKRDVQSLYANRQQQENQLKNQQQTLAELNEILSSYQRQYEAGYKSWLEVLNMQRELSDQKQNQLQANIDSQIYTLQLKALMGELETLLSEKEQIRHE